jgi:hypothetical protein
VPQRRRRKRLGVSTTPDGPVADAPNTVWAADFQYDATNDGRPLKIVSVVDEHTRECDSGRRSRETAVGPIPSMGWLASRPNPGRIGAPRNPRSVRYRTRRNPDEAPSGPASYVTVTKYR